MKSTTSHVFSQVPQVQIPRSSFDRSHGYKTTFDEGLLIPFLLDEALPGDTFNVNLTAFSRLATPIFPVMDNMFMDTQFFAVPIRLVWDNWQKFNGEQIDPGDSTDFTVPVMTAPAAGGHALNSLSDYMGIPTEINSLEHNSLFHRAYNLIWNEWYRDENLQDSVVVDRDDGPDLTTDYSLLRRGKRHDYFTSCLPWPQKGDAVSIPLGSIAPVVSDGTKLAFSESGSAALNNTYMYRELAAVGSPMRAAQAGSVGTDLYYYDGMQADLTNATAATINQLRQSFQIQRLLERDARGGSRYTEIIRSHFGVTSPDQRLQRCEFLGGGSSPVVVSPVAQTSSTDATTPQGNVAAFGTCTIQGHGFTKSFTEHCLIIGLVSVRADLTYQQGLDRMFSRQTRYDFYWPALAQIGEQAVTRKEIYTDGTANDDIVFGYQERYAEYRYKPSRITGLFRSNATGTLDAWHLAQSFGSAPVLDATFIVENAPVDRIIAVPAEPHFIFDSYIRMNCARPMPVYGVPGFIDHF